MPSPPAWGDIYRNSVITICGPDANSADAGFLHDRKTTDSDAWVYLKQPGLNGRETDLRLSTFPCTDREDWRKCFKRQPEAPLGQRAWVLQERILSSRVLCFGKHQLLFECNTTEFHEAYWAPSIGVQTKFSKWHHWKSLQVQVPNSGLNVSKTYSAWNSIVEEYSQRLLPHASDKLPAVSALAERFHLTVPDDQYLAGVWCGWLERGLIWSIVHPTTSLQEDDAGMGKLAEHVTNELIHGIAPGVISSAGIARKQVPSEIRGFAAPSWSWASHDLPVKAEFLGIDVDMKIISADDELAAVNAYGEVRDGRLVVRGRIYPLALEKRVGFRSLTYDAREYEVWYVPDVLDPGPPAENLTCLLAACEPREHDVVPWQGLVVKACSTRPGFFCRVGKIAGRRCSDCSCALSWDEHWLFWAAAERMELTIV